MPPPRIFIIDDEAITVQRLVQALQKDGWQVEGFISAQEALAAVRKNPPDIVISDIRLQDADGVDLMERIRAMAPDVAVILITGYATIDQAVVATKKGAFHYLAKPFKLAELRSAVNEALAEMTERIQRDRLEQELRRSGRYGEIIGVSPSMRRIFKDIAQVAPLDCNVLIQGESGTGKELVARALHANSPRTSRPFIPFNCGAFSEDLIANEFFGHEKGAFTGAVTTKLGLFEAANGGTVFLDEVGEMPQAMQVKLLRVIQERTFLRVGGVEPVALDVRLIAATNRDIEKMVQNKEFRQDLYYRLKVVTLELPPLRERREDIPALVHHFLEKTAQKFSKEVTGVSSEFLDRLAAYPFPGNVRELEHIVERAVALCKGGTLEASDLPPDLSLLESPPETEEGEEVQSLKSLEKDYIFDVYRKTGFNQSETARILGISRTTLWRRLRAFNLLGKSN